MRKTIVWWLGGLVALAIAFAIVRILSSYSPGPVPGIAAGFFGDESDARVSRSLGAPTIAYDDNLDNGKTVLVDLVVPRTESEVLVSGLTKINHWPEAFGKKYENTDATGNDASCFYFDGDIDATDHPEYRRMPPGSVFNTPLHAVETGELPFRATLYNILIPGNILAPGASYLFIKCALEIRPLRVSFTDRQLEFGNPTFTPLDHKKVQYGFTVRDDQILLATNVRPSGNYDETEHGYRLRAGGALRLTWTPTTGQDVKDLLLVALGLVGGLAATCLVEGTRALIERNREPRGATKG